MDILAWKPEYRVPPYCTGEVLMTQKAIKVLSHTARVTSIDDCGINDENLIFTGVLRKKARIPLARIISMAEYQASKDL